MKSSTKSKDRENGSVLIIALLVLMLMTVIGIAATRTTQIELRLSGNEESHKMAFYSAEAGISYVVSHPALYGPLNASWGKSAHYFPIDEEDPYSPNTTDNSKSYPLNPKQSFKGEVQYLGSSPPPRGSGTEVGTFQAYDYRARCYGYGPAGAESRMEAGFYRIGF